MWILKYYRYYREDEFEADSKEEALRIGCDQEDYGNISMSALINPDGEIVMDKQALSHYYIYRREDE